MSIPESLPQVLAFIAMLVPGISFVTVRTWFVGWRSPDYGAGSRVLEALYVSAIFVIVYVSLGLLVSGFASETTGMVSLGSFEIWATGGWRLIPAWLLGLSAVVLLVLSPVVSPLSRAGVESRTRLIMRATPLVYGIGSIEIRQCRGLGTRQLMEPTHPDSSGSRLEMVPTSAVGTTLRGT
jgi:hypothetical protein